MAIVGIMPRRRPDFPPLYGHPRQQGRRAGRIQAKSALKPRWSKRVPPQQPQVDDSNTQEIRERAGQSGIPCEPVTESAVTCPGAPSLRGLLRKGGIPQPPPSRDFLEPHDRKLGNVPSVAGLSRRDVGQPAGKNSEICGGTPLPPKMI